MNITDKAALVLQEIKAALALAEKATKGPWKKVIGKSLCSDDWRMDAVGCTVFDCSFQHYEGGGDPPNDDDAAFIAASRTLLPKLAEGLKTAIERGIYEMEHFPNNWCENTLRDILDQWEAGK